MIQQTEFGERAINAIVSFYLYRSVRRKTRIEWRNSADSGLPDAARVARLNATTWVGEVPFFWCLFSSILRCGVKWMPSLHHSLVSYIEYPCSFTVDFSSVPKREYPNPHSRPASVPVKEIQMSENSQAMNCHQNADMDLLFFSSIDEATKMWLDTLHRMWALCKHVNFIFLV